MEKQIYHFFLNTVYNAVNASNYMTFMLVHKPAVLNC